jgi:hypothetical protein
MKCISHPFSIGYKHPSKSKSANVTPSFVVVVILVILVPVLVVVFLLPFWLSSVLVSVVIAKKSHLDDVFT